MTVAFAFLQPLFSEISEAGGAPFVGNDLTDATCILMRRSWGVPTSVHFDGVQVQRVASEGSCYSRRNGG
jgi:hypothetical protein